METGNSNALTSLILSIGLRLNKPPVIASTSIQKHRDKEQIDEATGEFQVIGPGSLPRVNHVLDTRHIADVEMLPAAVGWNGVIFVRPKIALPGVNSSS